MPEIKKYLSKEGLQTYNETLPHSATQMQEYVNDWLSEHPEATTTVQDGTVTTRKLADDAVTTPKLADGGVTQDKLAQGVLDAIEISTAANALMGDPSESTWSRRTSAGSGMARVESVQGAAVVWNQLIRVAEGSSTATGVTVTKHADGSVTVEGTATNIHYASLDSSLLIPIVKGHKYLVYGPTSDTNLNLHIPAAGVMSQLFGGRVYEANQDSGATSYAYLFIKATFSGTYTFTPQLFDLTQMFGAGNEPATVAEFERMFPEAYYPYSAPTLKPVQIAGITSTDAQGGELDGVEWKTQTLRAAGSVRDVLYSDHVDVLVGERAYHSGDENDATVRTDGTTTYYPLATTTTTPVSPALPMSYKVEQGGTESIIVPSGEISAAPVLTVAEGENAKAIVMNALAAIAMPDGPTAAMNHSIDTYLTMSGKLYRVTRSIAVGETIVADTNVTQTTVMDELIARTA